MENLREKAIEAALCQNWPKAIEVNDQILRKTPKDIFALNRLAFAYQTTGQIKKAQNLYKKVLILDKFNNIAVKNLAKLSQFKGKTTKPLKSSGQREQFVPFVSPSRAAAFLEEPGKTRLVNLINLAPAATLFKLTLCEKLFLKPKRHSIALATAGEVYVGALPDDLSHRLIKLIKGGNTYEAYLKSLSKKNVLVLLREASRSKKFINVHSFPIGSGKIYSADIRAEALAGTDQPSSPTMAVGLEGEEIETEPEGDQPEE